MLYAFNRYLLEYVGYCDRCQGEQETFLWGNRHQAKDYINEYVILIVLRVRKEKLRSWESVSHSECSIHSVPIFFFRLMLPAFQVLGLAPGVKGRRRLTCADSLIVPRDGDTGYCSPSNTLLTYGVSWWVVVLSEILPPFLLCWKAFQAHDDIGRGWTEPCFQRRAKSSRKNRRRSVEVSLERQVESKWRRRLCALPRHLDVVLRAVGF